VNLRTRTFACAAALIVASSLSAQQQQQVATGSVAGRVSGADSVPLARARVAIVGTDLYVLADNDGLFALQAVPRGNRELDVRMIGYAPGRLTIEVRPGETLFVRPQLVALDPVALPNVAVVAVYSGPLRGFEERRLHGPGTFLTRADIAKYRPRHVTDVLRRIPALQIRPVAGFYGENLAVMQRGNRCPVLFYVNGSPLPIAEVAINNYVSAEDLVGVEVYTPSELPAQFNSSAVGAKCGMVGLWTRSGNVADEP
jgi:hypothetical protein